MFKLSAASASELIQEHQDELTSYLIQRNHCPETAADILQDAFIRLLNSKTKDEIKNPRAFLYRIVSNLAIDYHRSHNRRQAKHVDESQLADLPEQAPTLEHQVYTQEKIEFLKQAVSELPPRCKQVFIMHKFRNYPYSRIMTELGISESTVLKHIVKAMTHCRKRMKELDS